MSELAAFRAVSRARAKALARTPRTSSGKRTSATWPCLAPFHQPHNAARGQPANRFARRACGKVDIVRQPRNRKPQPSLSFQVAVPQQVDIHDVVDHRQPQLRRHHVFDLLPQRLRVDFFSRPVASSFRDPALLSPSVVAVYCAGRLLPMDCRLSTVSCRLTERSDTPIPLRLLFFMIGDPVGALSSASWSAAALLPL